MIGLAVSAIILLAAIESALNRIFRVRKSVYLFQVDVLSLLTIGPLLIGMSLSLSIFYAVSAGSVRLLSVNLRV